MVASFSHSGIEGARSGGEAFLQGESFTPFLSSSLRSALKPAVVGACIAVLGSLPGYGDKSVRRTLAFGLLGGVLGMSAGVAWESPAVYLRASLVPLLRTLAKHAMSIGLPIIPSTTHKTRRGQGALEIPIAGSQVLGQSRHAPIGRRTPEGRDRGQQWLHEKYCKSGCRFRSPRKS